MLDAITMDLNELTHGDAMQRELALTFAQALHSHTCGVCRMLRVCTVVDCRMRKFPVEEREYVCFVCQCREPEWSADEVGGGGDE